MGRPIGPSNHDLLKYLEPMQVDDFMIWPIEPCDPSKIHPEQRVISNYAFYYKKRFHTCRFGKKLYIIRIK